MSAGVPICALGTQKSLRELSESKCNRCDMLVVSGMLGQNTAKGL